MQERPERDKCVSGGQLQAGGVPIMPEGQKRGCSVDCGNTPIAPPLPVNGRQLGQVPTVRVGQTWTIGGWTGTGVRGARLPEVRTATQLG